MLMLSKLFAGRAMLAAIGLIAASAASASTFTQAAVPLSAGDVAALRATPPAVMDALLDVSRVASAWECGALPTTDAAGLAAEALGRLTASWPELAPLSPETRWVAHRVSVLVIATQIKPLMVASEWKADGPLSEALVGWLEESGGALRPLFEESPPSSPCFTNFAGCIGHCVQKPSWVERSVCMLDCELSLVACLGRALSPFIKPQVGAPSGGSGSLGL